MCSTSTKTDRSSPSFLNDLYGQRLKPPQLSRSNLDCGFSVNPSNVRQYKSDVKEHSVASTTDCSESSGRSRESSIASSSSQEFDTFEDIDLSEPPKYKQAEISNANLTNEVNKIFNLIENLENKLNKKSVSYNKIKHKDI